MQVTETEDGLIYHVRPATHPSSLRVHVANNVLPNLRNIYDCVAALAFYASRTSHPSIQEIKLASRFGSSLVSIEAYENVGDPIEKMLFVLLIEKGEWDYCSPAQIPFQNIRQVATALITTVSPHLQMQRRAGHASIASLHPSLG